MTRSALARTDPHQIALDGVVRTADLRAAGVSNHAISTRCRPAGPWQRILPGVVLVSGAPPDRRQLVRSALLYAGPEAVLTGGDAVRAHGIDVPETAEVLVLIPAGRRTASHSYVAVERTTRLPRPMRRDGLPVAPLVRATVDAARRERDHQRLTALLLAPVREGACTTTDLLAELNRGSQRGTAAIRALLTDRERDVVPVTHGLARRVLRRAPLPPPRWQVDLYGQNGTSLGVADAWWPDAGLAWCVGRQGHGVPADERTRAALTALGVTVLHTDPERLRTDPDVVVAELTAAFAYAAAHPHRR